MNAYSRIYKAPKSPFTPLQPLATKVFTFDTKNQIVSTTMSKTPVKSTSSNYLTAQNTDSRLSLTPCTVRGTNSSSQLSITPVKSISKCPVITVGSSKIQPTSTTAYQSNKNLDVAGEECNSKMNSRNFLNNLKTGVSYERVVECIKYDGNNAVKYSQVQKIKKSKDPIAPSLKNYKVCSPVPPRKICPKMEKTLKTIGKSNYLKLFADEEIDYETFRHFTAKDLKAIGIDSRQERDVFLTATQN